MSGHENSFIQVLHSLPSYGLTTPLDPPRLPWGLANPKDQTAALYSHYTHSFAFLIIDLTILIYMKGITSERSSLMERKKPLLTPPTGAQTCKHVSERTNTLTLMTAELFRYLAGAATEITSSKYLIPVSLLILVLCQRFDPKSAFNLRLWAARD